MADKKILIVDDKPENLQTIVHFLEQSAGSYQLMQALDGKTAFAIAREEAPDLVVTDWEMPIANGISLIQQLQAHKPTANIPVIMCTGVMTTSEHLLTALQAGATDYIRKPVDPLELYARVRSALLLAESYQQLIEKNEQLEQLNNMKNKFFSIIAHDLRSPFSSLIGFSKLFKENVSAFSNEELQSLGSKLHDATVNGFKLLENLLEWSRMQTNSFTFQPQPVLLAALIEEIHQLFSWNLKEKGIAFSADCPSGMYVTADPNMLASIFRNLISNAIKFTENGDKVSVTVTQSADKQACISVTDTGTGMTENQQGILFKMDQNQSTLGTSNEKGTGLGLLLCQEFAEMHGSSIQVISKKGEGSTFSFYLPIATNS